MATVGDGFSSADGFITRSVGYDGLWSGGVLLVFCEQLLKSARNILH